MRLDGQGQDRVALPGVLVCWVSLPAAGRNAQSIGRPPGQFVTGTTFLPFPLFLFFFFSPFPPYQLSLPRHSLWSWGKRPWVVQDEIDKGRRNYGAVQE